MDCRNAFLEGKGAKAPKSKKTGTTICGAVFKVNFSFILIFIINEYSFPILSKKKDGVVLGADTRATEGPIVCDKNCEKIHYIAKNIYCCGAGTAADTENTTGKEL